jgi:hypothetical protein
MAARTPRGVRGPSFSAAVQLMAKVLGVRWFRRDVETDVEDELTAHIEMRREDLTANGGRTSLRNLRTADHWSEMRLQRSVTPRSVAHRSI